jgi:hypothetical protein
MPSVRQILYTASIVTFDGSDTNAYGELCEPGQGYTEQSGFWDPDRASTPAAHLVTRPQGATVLLCIQHDYSLWYHNPGQ